MVSLRKTSTKNSWKVEKKGMGRMNQRKINSKKGPRNNLVLRRSKQKRKRLSQKILDNVKGVQIKPENLEQEPNFRKSPPTQIMEGLNSTNSLASGYNPRTNANHPANAVPNERLSNLPTNATNQPNFPHNTNGNAAGQPRLIRMESSSSNMNQQIRYQESRQPSQQNIYMNYNQGQRLPQPTSAMPNNAPAPNASYQNPASHDIQRHPAQVERAHPGQQPRFSGPMPSMRPLLNDQMNTPRPQMTQVAGPPKLPTEQMGFPKDPNSLANSSFPPESESKMKGNVPFQPNNREREVSKNPPAVLSRKSSNLDVGMSEEFHNNRQNDRETKPKLETQPEIISHNQTVQRKETTQHQPSRQPSVENFLRERENTNLSLTQDTKRPETGSLQKQDSSSSISSQNSRGKSSTVKEKNKRRTVNENITSGTVKKNIKFFEDNDTAKTPLTPKTITGTERPKREKVSGRPDVVRSQSNCDKDYESGVDETPVIHPDLRSIHQEPRKVAKIPKLKFKNRARSKANRGRFKKPFWDLDETKKYEKGLWKSNYVHPWKSFSKKQKIQFSPKEELLAFFHNSKSARLLRRDGNNESDRKDKLVSKPTANGDIATPKKTPSKLPGPPKKSTTVSSPSKASLKSPGTPGTPGTPGSRSLPKTPETPSPPTPLIKKVPMNKIQVGSAPSPNLKVVRSKVGSLVNTTHKPGGGNVKIESHKVDFSKAQPRIEAKNDQYARSGGDKKIPQVKLQWAAKSKVGSLENATYKPGGGDKKIETVKLDFKEKAKPKVGSKDNVKHVPGGGTVKIENQKLEFKAQSKVGSLDNVKHRPGGGDVKIFDDKTYLKQISGNSSEGRVSGTQNFGDLSIVREVEGKSAPGTPGPKVSVKIKKTTTIQNEGTTPTLKNVTEVMVASQTHKKGVDVKISSPGHQVKLTYSKLSPSCKNENKETVEIVKVPAKDHAPVLKPSLSNTEAPNNAEKNILGPITIHQVTGSKEKFVDFHTGDLIREGNTSESMRNISGSSNFPDGKFYKENDSGMSKFLRDEIIAQKKVGEMWREMNNLGESKMSSQDKVNEQRLQQKPSHYFPTSADQTPGNTVQFHKPQISSEYQKPLDSQVTNPQFKSDLSHLSNFPSYQSPSRTTQLQNNHDVSLKPQSQQVFSQNMSQQRNYERIPITAPQPKTIFPVPQPNQSFSSNSQFYQYDTK